MISEELKKQLLEFNKNPVTGNVKWKNVQTFSQGDKERVPTIFETNIAGIRIYFLIGHIHYPDQWLYSAQELGIKDNKVNGDSPREIAEKVITILKTKVEAIHGTFKLVNL